MLFFTMISSIPRCDFEHSSKSMQTSGNSATDAHDRANDRAVLPDGVDEVGVDVDVDADFLLTPPPSPKDTTTEPEVQQDALAVPPQAQADKEMSVVEWRRAAPCWTDFRSFSADVGLSRLPTSGHKNCCLYFSYQGWSEPDLTITQQNSRCARGGRAFMMHPHHPVLSRASVAALERPTR